MVYQDVLTAISQRQDVTGNIESDDISDSII